MRGFQEISVSGSNEMAELVLNDSDTKWGQKCPMIARSWRNVWSSAIPFSKFPPEIRRATFVA